MMLKQLSDYILWEVIKLQLLSFLLASLSCS